MSSKNRSNANGRKPVSKPEVTPVAVPAAQEVTELEAELEEAVEGEGDAFVAALENVAVAVKTSASEQKAKPKSKPVTHLSADSSELSDAQKDKVRDIKAAGGTVEIVKCSHCGKILVKDTSVEAEEGDYCSHLFDELGYTKEGLLEHRKSMSATEAPAGWIKVAALHRICVHHGIPVAAMVKAMGGDRALAEPLHPKFAPLYVGNARWLDPWCASPEGLAFLKGMTRGTKIGIAEGKKAVKTEKVEKDAFAKAIESAAEDTGAK